MISKSALFRFFTAHRTAWGISLKKNRSRPFLPEKAEELAIPPGPWRKDLVDGKTITLPRWKADNAGNGAR